jgi:hypothetical protein
MTNVPEQCDCGGKIRFGECRDCGQPAGNPAANVSAFVQCPFWAIPLIPFHFGDPTRCAKCQVERAQPAHLWPCGCLRNDAGAHRVGCPEHPKGVNPNG